MDVSSGDFPVEEDVWWFRARPPQWSDYEAGVVDGDTYDIQFDTGFGQRYFARVRSMTLDTAEIFGVSKDSEEYQQGTEQRDFVREWMSAAADIEDAPEAWPLVVRSYRATGKYGRWLADVYNYDGEQLAEVMVEEYGEGVLSDY